MHLLQGCSSPTLQFASASLLIDPIKVVGGNNVIFSSREVRGDSLFVVSPHAFISHNVALECITDLHSHLNSHNNGSTSTESEKKPTQRKNKFERASNSQRTDGNVHVYRSLYGIGLQYIVIHDSLSIQNISHLLTSPSPNAVDASSNPPSLIKGKKSSSSKFNKRSTSPALPRIEKDFRNSCIIGVVVCVGMTGALYSHPSSLLLHELPHRLHESVIFLTLFGRHSSSSIGDRKKWTRTMLSSLLYEENDLKNSAEIGTEEDEEMQSGKTGGISSKPGSIFNFSSSSGKAPPPVLGTKPINTAHMSRMEAERMHVLAISEKDMNLSGEMLSNSSLRSLNSDDSVSPLPDLDAFDYVPPPQSHGISNASLDSRDFITNPLKIQKIRQQQPKTISFTDPSALSTAFTISPKMIGNANDEKISDQRKKKFELNHWGAGTDNQFSKMRNDNQRTIKFPVHINNTPKNRPSDFASLASPITTVSDLKREPHPVLSLSSGINQLISPEPENNNEWAFSPFPFKGSHVSSVAENAATSSITSIPRSADGFNHKFSSDMMDNRVPVLNIDINDHMQSDVASSVAPSRITVQSGESSQSSVPKVMIKLALNEDLTCSYRNSKISSCSVEGVVQVHVKYDYPIDLPFCLIIKDPSKHIQTIQENKKFAKDVSHETFDNHYDADYRFEATVSKADHYFPIVRYNCTSDLRPVPIRVQSRVRLNENFCRVALQISSNPSNENDLTDLTILMAVPDEVKGDSLSTSPPGGMWNAAKRSVLWCVAELGTGEKFQLQAQFEMVSSEPEDSTTAREKPIFPVLVRCQSMYSQISDVELDVCEVSRPITPTEISMKVARRFRLSHREKS